MNQVNGLSHLGVQSFKAARRVRQVGFLQRDDHACDLASEHLVLSEVHLVEQDLLDEGVDEVASRHPAFLVGVDSCHTCHELRVALLVDHRDVLGDRDLDDRCGLHRLVNSFGGSSSSGHRCCLLLRLALLHLLLGQVGNQLYECQQELALLCLQLMTDVLQLLHGSLVLQILQVTMELQNVHALIKLGDSLLFRLELVDVQLPALEHQTLCVVLGCLGSFQCLEGDKAEANKVFRVFLFLPGHQMQVVDVAELCEVLSQLLLQSFNILADREATEV